MKSAQESLDEAIRNGSARVTSVNTSHLTQAEGVRFAVATHDDLVEALGQSEDYFQKQVIDLAHSHGWKVAHFRKVRVQRADGSTYWETPVAADGKGFPDLLMTRASRHQIIVAELKVGKNQPSDEQWEWIHDLGDILVDLPNSAVVIWRPEDWPTIIQHLTGKVWETDDGHDERLKAIQKDDGCPHDED